MDVAFALLSRRAHSSSEILEALAARGASRTTAGKVLSRLQSLGYVDDAKLAADFAERWKERGFGALRIEAELRRIGLEDSLVEEVIAASDEREERKRARAVLAKRFSDEDLRDRRAAARAARFLAGRGFAAEVIDSLFEVWN